jgi:hypothetical protein
MRTKTLLAAAVLAAGLATSMAQSNVYSINVVGYVNQTMAVGFSMVATPLKATNDTIATLMPNPPSGTVVYKFTGGAYQAPNIFDPGEGGWAVPGQTLPAGQGYFVKSPSQWTNTFVGEVIQSLSTNALINGFNMVGSIWPAAGQIGGLFGGVQVTGDLKLVPTSGDTIYSFNNGGGYNAPNIYDPGEGGWASPPNLNVAQGVFYKSVGAKNWVQNFTVQ